MIMFDVQLVSIWKAPKFKGYYINHHAHNCYELVYYSYGNGETTIGEQTYFFTDNCFALIPPYVSHDELHRADAEVICLEFSCSSQLPQSFIEDENNVIYKILKELLSEAKNQKYGYKEMINAKLTELCLNVLRNENKTYNEKSFEYIINYLKENYHEKIILSNCAKQLNISYDHFQHRFKEITGLSPQQFLVDIRLVASENLLKSGNLSCTQIAYRCGFSTSAQFSALFKRKYGVSPLKFRNQIR